MKYTAVVLSVADVKAARGFYEDLFGLEVCQDYGINVSFTCGLSLPLKSVFFSMIFLQF